MPELHFVTGEHLSWLAAKRDCELDTSLDNLGAMWQQLVTQKAGTLVVSQTSGLPTAKSVTRSTVREPQAAK